MKVEAPGMPRRKIVYSGMARVLNRVRSVSPTFRANPVHHLTRLGIGFTDDFVNCRGIQFALVEEFEYLIRCNGEVVDRENHFTVGFLRRQTNRDSILP
jgi:hypothetical protein